LRQAEGSAKIFGVFRVKNHDFPPKNHIFPILGGGGARNFWDISCEKSRFYAKKIIFFPILGGTRAGCAPPESTPDTCMQEVKFTHKKDKKTQMVIRIHLFRQKWQ
jgi:hypothetical protein